MVAVTLRKSEQLRGRVKSGQPEPHDGLKRAFDLRTRKASQRVKERRGLGPVQPREVGDLGSRNHAVKQQDADAIELEDLVVVPKLRRDGPHQPALR